MGMAAKNFAGQQIYIPGIYTKNYFPPQTGGGVASNIVAVVGSALGGVPYNAADYDESERYNVFAGITEAIREMRGGKAYYMGEIYLSPTKDETLSKPSFFVYFRVDPATRALSSIKKSGDTAVIDLKSRRYGKFANQLCKKVVAGTNKGKKITVKLAGDQVAEKDDIYLEYFDIQYTGSGSAAVIAINATGITTTITGGTENLSISFADFPTVGQVVDYISKQTGYVCSLKGSTDAKSNTLDAVTSQDIKTALYTCAANVEAVIQFFNRETGGEIIANLTNGASRDALLNDAGFVFFTGGDDGTATNTNWSNCLELMEKFQINHILVASGDPTIHALVDAHCQKMSAIKGKKNRSWSAGASAAVTTKSARIAEAKAINSARAEYWVTPFYRYDNVNGGALTKFDPFYFAAIAAGIRYGNKITTSATFKSPNVVKFAEEYKDIDKEDYIKNGCSLAGINEKGEFEVIHNVTTYQGANLILNLPSMLRTTDYITLDSQAKLKQKIAALDEAPSGIQISAIMNYITSSLLPSYRDDDKLITDDPQTGRKAFSNVSFTIEGDAFNFKFTGVVVAPLHYGFMEQTFVVVGQ